MAKNVAQRNECVTIWDEYGTEKCFCMWNFPSTGAYFWFRLIAGDVPMVIVIISYYKIKKTLSLQGSIMSELMRHTIDQSTIVVKAGCEPKTNSNPLSNYFSSRPQHHKMGNLDFIFSLFRSSVV